MRFKELRGLSLDILLLGMDIILISRNLDNKMKLMICIVLSFVVLMSLFSQFYVKVLKDSVFFYRFFGIFLIPSMIEFKDIQEMTLKSKFHLILSSEFKRYHILVLNAEKLKNAIQKNMEDLENETH